jgi:hypothetical protein
MRLGFYSVWWCSGWARLKINILKKNIHVKGNFSQHANFVADPPKIEPPAFPEDADASGAPAISIQPGIGYDLPGSSTSKARSIEPRRGTIFLAKCEKNLYGFF